MGKRSLIKLFFACLILFFSGLLLFSPASSEATTITFVSTFEYSNGTAPSATQPPPWLTATFDDGGGSGSVTLTMKITNLSGTEFVSEWLFNLASPLNPESLNFSFVSGIEAVLILHNPDNNSYPADGGGYYDIDFQFQTSDSPNAQPPRFTDGLTSVYTITLDGLTASSFEDLGRPHGGQGPFYSAAHVQNTGTSGSGSGWVALDRAPVPEPATMFLLGSGLIGLVVLARRRFRKQ